MQNTRGTFGSGGEFEPFRHEARDCRATLDWLAAQPWFGGSVAMVGGSYLGFAQWAVAADAPVFLKALAPMITASQFRSLVYGGESFSLDTTLTWVHMVHHQELAAWRILRATLTQRKALAPAFAHAPLNELDAIAVGHHVTYFQDWLGRHAGPRDNRKLEARPDVLTYTSAPLDRDLAVIDPVAAELYVRSSLPHTDFFVRLCDVEPSGAFRERVRWTGASLADAVCAGSRWDHPYPN